MEDAEILKTILKKLDRNGYWGGRHTSAENLTHGFPGHLKKKVKQVIDVLLKSGWLIVKPKPDSLHVSLNSRYTPEIVKFIKSQDLNTT